MKILAFESSAKAASAAVLDDGRLLAESYQNSGLTHSRTLLQMAEDLLKHCDLTAHDIDAAAVAAGPGSFTGVRIGVAAAKGFCWGREIPCYGVSTLEAMARTVSILDGLLVPAMDARRSQVSTAACPCHGGVVARVMDDCAIAVEELGERLKKLEGAKFLVGDGAELCYNTLGDTLPGLRLVPEHLRFQRASGVALAAWDAVRRGEKGDAASLAPSYLRMSQAERERMRKQREETKQHE